MATIVLNTTDIMKEVKIRDKSGKVDSVNVMARSRATLPSGSTVDPVYARMNSGQIVIHNTN